MAEASPEIDAYLNQFSSDDPEACFNDPAPVNASFGSPGAADAPVPPARVIVAIDASGSMAGRVSSRQKLDFAKSASTAFVEELRGLDDPAGRMDPASRRSQAR